MIFCPYCGINVEKEKKKETAAAENGKNEPKAAETEKTKPKEAEEAEPATADKPEDSAQGETIA